MDPMEVSTIGRTGRAVTKNRSRKSIFKQLCLILTMIMAVGKALAYDFMVDGIAYNILSASDLTCEVVGCYREYAGDLIIPSTVRFQNRELRVVELGDKCFQFYADLTSIEIPSSVTSIGLDCFLGCTGLTSIKIPSSVTYIAPSCFYGCTGLASIEIPSSVTLLGPTCFYGCTSLTSIKIPAVTYLGSMCFYGCTNLTSIEMPSVETIEDECFLNCSGLTSIELPSSITSLKTRCFYGCTGLTSIKIPSSVETIDVECFANCANLATVICKAKRIERGAFHGTSLTFLTIGKDTEKIDLGSLSYYPKVYTFPVGIKHITFEDRDMPIEVKGDYSTSWARDLESLYLGGELNGTSLKCPDMKELTLGTYVGHLRLGNDAHGISYYQQLISLVALNTTPPIIGTPSQMQYVNLEVEVPEEALDAYKSDPIWGQFWNLKGISSTQSVAEIPEREVTGYYDLSGRQVDENISGMVIVRFSDGSARKMIKR